MPKRDRLPGDLPSDRWERKYPRFPGVAECLRLIRAGKARGEWADIIEHQLAANAGRCLDELAEGWRTDPDERVRLYILMALDIARIPESVPFLAEVLRGSDERCAYYAEEALKGINTREARTALWQAKHSR